MVSLKSQQRIIILSIICEGETYQVSTFPNEYRSLMMLIYDKISPEEFGDCLGMGKCGTCLVEILGDTAKLSSFERNEQTTISKAGINENYRLACQILIDENLNEVVVKIINSSGKAY